MHDKTGIQAGQGYVGAKPRVPGRESQLPDLQPLTGSPMPRMRSGSSAGNHEQAVVKFPDSPYSPPGPGSSSMSSQSVPTLVPAFPAESTLREVAILRTLAELKRPDRGGDSIGFSWIVESDCEPACAETCLQHGVALSPSAQERQVKDYIRHLKAARGEDASPDLEILETSALIKLFEEQVQSLGGIVPKDLWPALHLSGGEKEMLRQCMQKLRERFPNRYEILTSYIVLQRADPDAHALMHVLVPGIGKSIWDGNILAVANSLYLNTDYIFRKGQQ